MDDSVQELLKLLKAYRRTLTHYLGQEAMLGSAHTRPEVTNGIEEARNNIGRIKKELRERGVEVEDEPYDEPPKSVPKDTRGNDSTKLTKVQLSLSPSLALPVVGGLAATIALIVVALLVTRSDVLRQVQPEPTSEPPMTAQQLRDAGAYIRIESIEAPGVVTFTKGQTIEVELVVSYYLPGPASIPSINVRYPKTTTPYLYTTTTQPVGTGENTIRIRSPIVDPKITDGALLPIKVDLDIIEGKNYVTLDSATGELKLKSE